jgi:hypothetical protein
MPKLDREAPNQYASRSQLNQTVNAKSKKSKAIRCDCRTDRDRSFNHPATGASRNVGSPVYDLVAGFLSCLPALFQFPRWAFLSGAPSGIARGVHEASACVPAGVHELSLAGAQLGGV